MIDQLIISDKASYDDFGASVALVKIGQPKKKTVRESVPFSNKTYDFSAIGGEVYWEDRELEYTFEMSASSPQELEEMKIAFSDWVMNVMEEEIHDPFIPDYHFKGTFDSLEYEDDESREKTVATVSFLAYPYKIANYETVIEKEIAPVTVCEFYVENKSSHGVTPTIKASTAVSIDLGATYGEMEAGTAYDESLQVPKGVTLVVVFNQTDETCTFSMAFREEVL